MVLPQLSVSLKSKYIISTCEPAHEVSSGDPDRSALFIFTKYGQNEGSNQIHVYILSHDVTSGSDIILCIKIDKMVAKQEGRFSCNEAHFIFTYILPLNFFLKMSSVFYICFLCLLHIFKCTSD